MICYLVMIGNEVVTATRSARTAATDLTRILAGWEEPSVELIFYGADESVGGFEIWDLSADDLADERKTVDRVARSVRRYAREFSGTAFSSESGWIGAFLTVISLTSKPNVEPINSQERRCRLLRSGV